MGGSGAGRICSALVKRLEDHKVLRKELQEEYLGLGEEHGF